MEIGHLKSCFRIEKADLMVKLVLSSKCLRAEWTSNPITVRIVWLTQTKSKRPWAGLCWMEGCWSNCFSTRFSKYFMTIAPVCFVIGPDGSIITLSQQTLKLWIGLYFFLCVLFQFLLWVSVAVVTWWKCVCPGKNCPKIVYLPYVCFIQICCIEIVAHSAIP